MLVVDIEGSGVDPHKNSLLSIGAVEFERPENQFYGECRVWDGAHIEPKALEVNGFTETEARDSIKQTDRELLLKFISWADTCDEKTLSGQNPSFDRDFMQITAARYHLNWVFAHRTIDLHSIAFFHAVTHRIMVPRKNNHSDFNLDKILVYAGLPPEPKPHNGLTGARLEAEAFSRFFNGKSLFPEWHSFKIPWV